MAPVINTFEFNAKIFNLFERVNCITVAILLPFGLLGSTFALKTRSKYSVAFSRGALVIYPRVAAI